MDKGAPQAVDPSGFDPSRDAFAISSSACFRPEDDDPENFDGRMVTWTFAAAKDTRCGPGLYRLQFIRILTPEERGNATAQLDAIATETRRAETTGSVEDEGAGRQASPNPHQGDH